MKLNKTVIIQDLSDNTTILRELEDSYSTASFCLLLKAKPGTVLFVKENPDHSDLVRYHINSRGHFRARLCHWDDLPKSVRVMALLSSSS